ncbi:hypothetical protein HAX54_050894 [Datura stramonium]|uniref:Uncharacterized protein n=1 Tax=Datura stramonium TaxID=4076 RepID=A0ABS8SXI3_DATST|nr:hypothetical protein [Datura stramonium]
MCNWRAVYLLIRWLILETSLTNQRKEKMGVQSGISLGTQDVPKLKEYLKEHHKEFRHTLDSPVDQVVHPIHDQVFYLTAYHKKKLKQEFGIEPWTFVKNWRSSSHTCWAKEDKLEVKKMALYALEKAVADLKDLECNQRNPGSATTFESAEQCVQTKRKWVSS